MSEKHFTKEPFVGYPMRLLQNLKVHKYSEYITGVLHWIFDNVTEKCKFLFLVWYVTWLIEMVVQIIQRALEGFFVGYLVRSLPK